MTILCQVCRTTIVFSLTLTSTGETTTLAMEEISSVPTSQLWKELVFSYVTTVIYILDIGSDIYLAILYFSGGWWWYLTFTSALILMPSIITAMWYNYCNSQDKWWIQILKFVASVLYITPVLAYWKYCTFSLMGCISAKFSYFSELPSYREKRINSLNGLIKEIGLMKVIEACLEAIPQAMTQTYIVYINLFNENGPHQGSTPGFIGGNVPLKVEFSVIASISSCTVCLYFIYKTWIDGSPYDEKAVTGRMTALLLVVGNFLILVGRIAAFVLLLVMSPYTFLLFIMIHLVVLAVISYHSDWEWRNETQVTENGLEKQIEANVSPTTMSDQSVNEVTQNEKLSQKTRNIVGSLAISIGYLVVPRGAINYLRLNPTKDENVAVFYWLAYWFMFAENLAIFSIWLLFSNEFKSGGYILGGTNGLYLIGMCLMWIHYKFYRTGEMVKLYDKRVIKVRQKKFGEMYKWLGL